MNTHTHTHRYTLQKNYIHTGNFSHKHTIYNIYKQNIVKNLFCCSLFCQPRCKRFAIWGTWAEGGTAMRCTDYAQALLFLAAHNGYRYCRWPLFYISSYGLHSPPQGPPGACSSVWTGTQEQQVQEQVELGLHWMLRHQKLPVQLTQSCLGWGWKSLP